MKHVFAEKAIQLVMIFASSDWPQTRLFQVVNLLLRNFKCFLNSRGFSLKRGQIWTYQAMRWEQSLRVNVLLEELYPVTTIKILFEYCTKKIFKSEQTSQSQVLIALCMIYCLVPNKKPHESTATNKKFCSTGRAFVAGLDPYPMLLIAYHIKLSWDLAALKSQVFKHTRKKRKALLKPMPIRRA